MYTVKVFGVGGPRNEMQLLSSATPNQPIMIEVKLNISPPVKTFSRDV